MKTNWITPLSVLALAVLVIAIASWYLFPGWQKTEGGFWQLLSVAFVSVLAIAKDLIAYVKEWGSLFKPKEKIAKKLDADDTVLADVPVTALQETKQPSGASAKAALRSLLLESFREQDLREVVSDHFPELSASIGSKSSTREIATELIEFVFSRRQVDELLAIVKTYNPRQYQHHAQAIQDAFGASNGKK